MRLAPLRLALSMAALLTGVAAKADPLPIIPLDPPPPVLTPEQAEAQKKGQDLWTRFLAAYDARKAQDAIPLGVEMLDLIKQQGVEGTIQHARCLGFMGIIHNARGQFDDHAVAVKYFLQAYDIFVARRGKVHEDCAFVLHELAIAYLNSRDLKNADDRLAAAREVNRQVLGDKFGEYVTRLEHDAMSAWKQEAFPQAELLFRHAMEAARSAFGDQDIRFAIATTRWAGACVRVGKLADARTGLESAGKLIERKEGKAGPNYALLLYHAGWLHQRLRDHAAAEAAYRQCIAEIHVAFEKKGESRELMMDALVALGNLYISQSRHKPAIATMSFAVHVASVEPVDIETYVNRLRDLARACEHDRDFPAAEQAIAKVLKIREELSGRRSNAYAAALTDLGKLLLAKGDIPRAEDMLLMAASTFLAGDGMDYPAEGECLENLGVISHIKQRHHDAERYYKEALTRFESRPGKISDPYARTVGHIARLAAETNELEAAAILYEVQRDIRGRLHGVNDPAYARALSEEAWFHCKQRQFDRAEPLFQQSVDIVRAAWGQHHPQYANAIGEQALLLGQTGRVERADAQLRTAIEIYLKAELPDHPNLAAIRRQHALLLACADRFVEAIDPMRADWSHQSREWDRAALYAGNQPMRSLSDITETWDLAFTIAAKLPGEPRVAAFAAELALSGKVKGLDLQARRQAWVLESKNPDIRRLAEEVRELATELDRRSMAEAALAAEGLTNRENAGIIQIIRGNLDVARLTLAEELAKEGNARPAQGLAEVAAALGASAALIEFVEYQPLSLELKDAAQRLPFRYGAVVVRQADKGAPLATFVPLGSTLEIDTAINAYRDLVGRPTSKPEDIDRAAAVVAGHVWRPCVAALGTCRKVYLAPTGLLSFVPFAALPSAEPGHYLLDDFDIGYVASGRDLLRSESVSTEPALIVGDPDFARAGGPADPIGGQNRQRTHQFSQLPGARDEAANVMKWLQSAKLNPKLLVGEQATESAVIAVRRPTILHLATHGFFVSNDPPEPAPHSRPASQPATADRGVGGFAPLDVARSRQVTFWDRLQMHDSMTRCGVALGGANLTLAGTRPAGGDDGILTATEVTRMDLLGTRLVVLSACESGLGGVASGEGVYGLRRAFAIAGAQHLVISLWSVDDRATAYLVGVFYQNLAKGRSPQLALLDAQRHYVQWRRQNKQYPHPFYWSAFAASGIGTPLGR